MDNNYKVCPNCKVHNEIASKFCVNCGYKFEVATTITQQRFMQTTTIQPTTNYNNLILCPNCKNYEYKGYQNCRQCGYVLISQYPKNVPSPSKVSCLGVIGWLFLYSMIIGIIIISFSAFSDTIKKQKSQNEHSDNYVENTDSTKSTTEEYITEETVTTTEEYISVSIDEKIIYEENDVIIKVTGIDKNNNVSFYIENNSTLNLGLNMHSYAVNGIMTNENIYTMDVDVAPNSKNNCTLEISNDFLKNNGIDVIKNLTLHIWAYDNDESFKEFDCGSIFIETSASDGTNNIQTGELLLEEEGLKYELIKTEDNVYYIGITNTNDILCECDVQNLVINDWTCDIAYDFDLMGLQILPNCQNIIMLDMTEHMQEKNITEIEYISFNLDVRRNADYFDNYIATKVIID